jgi:hypothetical protein
MKKLLPIVFMIGIIIFLNYFYIHPNVFVSPMKQCEKADDCAFAPTSCCPGCKGYEAFNKAYVTNISNQYEECSKKCPPVECYSPMGFIAIPRPVCQQGTCGEVQNINCRTVCVYYNSIETDALSKQYLQKATEFFGVSVEYFAENCRCLNQTNITLS